MNQVIKIIRYKLLIAICILILPHKPLAQIILSESFEGAFPPAGWTLFNAGTGNSWSLNTDPLDAYSGIRSMQYFYSFTNNANAWIFSPGINLTSGTIYRISYFYRGNITSTEKFKVTIGNGATVANQTTVLHDYPAVTNTSYLEGVDYFTPVSSGLHNLAFNCYSTANQYALLIDSIVIKPASMPAISSFVPAYGGTGATITITGTNFNGVNAVSFGGVPAASFTVNSPTSITATLAGGASGSVTVTNSFTSGTLTGFTYLTGLTFAPSSGPIGTAVTISGSGFDPVPANNIVFFGEGKATVTGGTTTSLNVIVPAGASHLPVTVNTNGITKYSTLPFIVTFSHGGGGFLPSSFVTVLDNVATGNNPSKVSTGDFDGDGKIDIVITNSNDNTISIFRNTSIDSSISFASRVNFSTATYPSNIVVADIDGDTKPDIVVTNLNSASVSVFRNTSTTGTISFASKVDFTTGVSPGSVAAGDLDGDGKADIAVVNGNNSNTVSVLRNTSIGSVISFTPKSDYITEQVPTCVALGDFDGDGKPDMAVSTNYVYFSPGQHSYVSVFKNNSVTGNIIFATRVDYATETNGLRVSATDVNVDGKLDIWVQTAGSGASVLRNTSSAGTISFATRQYIGWVATNIAIADLDGDGKPDVVQETNGQSSVGLLRNTSVGTIFSVAQRVELYMYIPPHYFNTLNACTADFDGDGKTDIISVNSENTFSVARNKMNEPFITSFNPPGGNQGDTITIKGLKFTTTQSVSFGGVAASYFSALSDTIIKAVVGAGSTGTIKVTTLYGSASVQRFVYPGIPVISSFSPAADTVGAAVTIAGNNFDPNANGNTVYFGSVKATILSASTTSLLVQVPAGISFRPISVTTNNVTAYSAKPFSILFTGGGTALNANSFAPKTDVSLGTSSNPSGIITGDIDMDGKPDVFTASYTNTNGGRFLKNLSSPETLLFGTASNLVTNGYSRNVITGDLDMDGKLDLIFGSANTWSLAIFLNNSTAGTISFAPKKDIAATGNPNDIAIGDLDGDGKSEMVVSSNVDNTFSVFRNTSIATGSVSFEDPIAFPTGTSSSPSGISISDIDGDGKVDVIVANQLLNNVSVFRNTSTNGIISFASKIDYAAGSAPIDVAVTDLDGDGKPDIIVANQSASISVLRNLAVPGSISFAAKIDFAIAGTTLYGISANDVDGDGKPDLAVVAGNTAKVYVFRNTGSPGVISLEAYVDYQLGNSPRSILLADIDIDGKPDILCPNYTGGDLSILRNQIGESATTVSVCANSTTTLTSNVTGTSYQWQQNTGSGFANITDNSNFSGTNTINLQINNIPSSWNGYQYRCYVNGSQYSNIFALSVSGTAVTPSVTIAANSGNSICTGTNVTFTATPVNGGTPTYQWKLNGNNIGTNSNTYSNNALANGDVITVTMTSSLACASPATVTSTGITMLVGSTVTPSVTIGANPGNSICSGTNVTFTATAANGGTPSYQWKLNGNNAGTNSNTYSNSGLVNGDVVTVVMISSLGCANPATATSTGITMNVGSVVVPSVSISVNPGNTICTGTNVTFTATPVNGGTPTYQWKLNGNNIGTNSNTYSNNALTNGDVITVAMTSSIACASPTTTTATGITMIVTSVSPAITISGTTTVNSGTPTILSSAIVNGGSAPTYQWQDSTSTHSWQNIAGSIGANFTYTPAITGDKVRCVLSSNATCATVNTVISNVLVFTVNTVTSVNPVAAIDYGIKAYPNPVTTLLVIDSLKLSDHWETVEITSIDGRQKLFSEKINGQTRFSINVEKLSGGYYVAILTKKQGVKVYVAFIKQ